MDEKLTKSEKKEIRKQEWHNELESERKKKLFTTLFLWGFGALLAVLAIVGLIAFSSNNSSNSSPSAITMPKITEKDYTQGPKNAKATLTEYSDFQCPACKAYYPVVKQIQKDYDGKLLFVYRFFPLPSVHKNAYASAQAGYAAGLQGKFWEMHDKLFETQDSWAQLPDPTATFTSFAKDVGLNVDQFSKDQSSDAAKKFVTDSYNADIALGLSGTPTFFLNGKLIANPNSYADFKKQIDNALK